MPKRVHADPGIAKMENGRWRARYRAPDGRERSKVFATKFDALAWRRTQLADRDRGDWIDPRGSRQTVEQLAEKWLATKESTCKPSTVADYREMWNSRLKGRWGSTPVSAIRPSDVQEWVNELDRAGQSSSRVRKLVLCLRQIVEIAVGDRRIARNPITKSVVIPRLPDPDPKPLTRDEFADLLEKLSPEAAPLAQGLVLTGMRIGEASALRVRNVVLDRANAHIVVAENMVVLAANAGGVQTGTPKSGRSRTIPLTAQGVAVFRNAIKGKSGDDLVFTNSNGAQIRARNYRAVLQRAAEAASLRPISPHDLRDTYASWAIASGANIKMLQAALGHKSATLTLDTYAKLLPDDMGMLRAGLDAAEKRWQKERQAGTTEPLQAARRRRSSR
jgi:integrase